MEEFKIDVKCYEDLDCFVEHDMVIVRRILDDADTAFFFEHSGQDAVMGCEICGRAFREGFERGRVYESADRRRRGR